MSGLYEAFTREGVLALSHFPIEHRFYAYILYIDMEKQDKLVKMRRELLIFYADCKMTSCLKYGIME